MFEHTKCNVTSPLIGLEIGKQPIKRQVSLSHITAVGQSQLNKQLTEKSFKVVSQS